MDICSGWYHFIIYSFFDLTVSNTVFIKKTCKSLSDFDSLSSVSTRSSIIQSNVKRSKLRRLFSRKEPDEEEYTLLPVYVKEKDQIRVVKKCTKSRQKDWWLRFFCSQQVSKNCSIKVHILGAIYFCSISFGVHRKFDTN